MLNSRIKGACENYQKINFLRGIGYTSFSNAEDLKGAFNKVVDKDLILLDQLDKLSIDSKDNIDIFYIKSSANSQAEMDTINFIKNSKYTQICDDSSEIAYEPLEWYLNSINKCKNLIIHLSSSNRNNYLLDNSINSFYAGLGYALGKKVLFIAPKPYCPPIDYNDLLIEYHSAENCVEQIKNWLNKSIKNNSNINRKIEEDKELNLLKLGIGYSVAEDERDDLLNYFIETDSYFKAISSRLSIFYGRKGSGKTALYIKLFNYFKNQPDTVLLGLKPESTELIENIQVTKLYNDVASKKSLFHTVWKYVLYSKLLTELYYRILKKKRIEYSKNENDIIEFYTCNSEKLNQDFLGYLKKLYVEIENSEARMANLIEKCNISLLIPMNMLIKEYFKDTKYLKLAILTDNLDKAWDSESDLSIQTEMILSLLEVSGKIQQELNRKKNNKIESSVIVFLRLDIYNYVLKKSREPDKLTISSHEVEWASCRDLLRRMIERRVQHVLELNTEESIDFIWKDYFDFKKEDIMEMVLSACLPRPRDVIIYFGKMFESACNNSRSKVNMLDYQYSLNYYSNYLYQNLIAEMSAEYPYIREIIEDLHLRFTDRIELNKFRILIKQYETDENKVKMLISDLFNNEYLVATDKNNYEKYIKYDDVLLAEQRINTKRWLFKRKSQIFIFQHPRYARNMTK